ncbi:MAG: nickel pincer cofactor biosynthesis protein LarC [Ignavibacteriaceae bacterium]
MKILFCDNIAGIAGDMFAASFINAGLASEDEVKSIPSKLGFNEIEIKIEKATKAFISAHHLEVVSKSKYKIQKHSGNLSIKQPHDHDHNPYLGVIERIENADIESEVKNISKAIYKELAEAEAAVHGISLNEVVFHEVGNPDSIIDVVLAGYCLNKISYDEAYSSPVKLGRGTIKIAHGFYPVPPPASLRLAKNMVIDKVPDIILEKDIELSTPTGLSILKYLDPKFVKELPGGKILAYGYGAGTNTFGQYPNVFRIVYMESENQKIELPYIKDKAIEISCNIDDQTAEKTGWCVEQLIERGALDVWVTPINTKKNRLAVCLSVLAKEEDWEGFADWIIRNTSTFGIRYKNWDRLILKRKIEKRRINEDKEINFKVGYTTVGEELKSKPEYEEIKKMWKK